MHVIDLTPGNHTTYFTCLEDWSAEMKEAGDHKPCWYNQYKDKGLSVKLAVSDGVYLDGKLISFGPLLPFDKIMQKITKRVKKLRE